MSDKDLKVIIKAAVDAAAARRRARRNTVTAIGTNWRASLVSGQRGPLVSRKAATQSEAFSLAHRLLDEAEDRSWLHGETVRVEAAQSDD